LAAGDSGKKERVTLVPAIDATPIDATPAKRPLRISLAGQYVSIVRLKPAEHGNALWEATRGAENDALWQYLWEGPFAERAAFDASLKTMEASEDPLYVAIIDKSTGKATGRASYLRIEPKQRCIEVGAILFSPLLQRTRGATEAMYLMMRHAFDDLRNRRYEWKCDARNEASRRAALRLGFTFEGIFRQHMIVKGQNRDTAWFSLIDGEWPRAKDAFERWLAPENFGRDGRQIKSLAALRGG
jgi:RimJ/RimL family protein N-acetyltransferase